MSARLLFVCRGSVHHGLGHVIRSRAVAEAAIERGIPTRLLCLGDEHAAAMLAGFVGEWSVAAEESQALASISDDPAAVILDMVELSDQGFQELTEGRLSVSLSPIFNQLEHVDLSFIRTRYAAPGQSTNHAGRHGGLDYTVVRSACERIDTGTFARSLDDETLAVGICMGGSDAPNRTLAILESLRQLESSATFWALLGEGYGHSYRELVDAVRRDGRHEVILAKTNRSMWRVLSNCSLAILAGGVTTYEAAYAGLPSINLLSRAEDEFLVRELVEEGAAIHAGTFDSDPAELLNHVARLEADREGLMAAHRRARVLVDGLGATRIVERIAREL